LEKNIQKSNLNHDDTRCAIDTTIGKTLSYPLPVTAFNPKQCHKIMGTFLSLALPRSGIVRSAARQIVHSPFEVMGFGYDDMDMDQLAEHIMIMIDHGNGKTVTGKLIRTLAEGMHIEIGFRGDLMKTPHKKIRWSEHTWLRNTLEGMISIKVHLKTTLPILQTWKEDDVFIMEEIQKLHCFNSSEMKIINEVRMHIGRYYIQ